MSATVCIACNHHSHTSWYDIVIQHHGKVVPIEVKVSTNVRSKSLAQFVKDNEGLKGLRLSLCQYVDLEWMENVPLYALRGWVNHS